MTDQPASLAEALAVLQTRLPDIKKGTEGQVGTRKYQYADLADISKVLLPVMGELGLSFSAMPTWVPREDGSREFILLYTLRHSSGEELNGEYPIVGASAIGNHQAIGSAITYGRRYCLCAITGAVADEDDDGASSGPPVAELKERLRATRRADPEVDEHGAATLAEQTRMITGPEPGTWRLPTTPVNDPFYDTEPQPQAAPDETTYDTSGTITRAQLTKIAVLFGELGYAREQRADRLALASRITGRPLRSSADLSKVEAGKLIEVIERSGTDYERLSASLDALETPAAQPSPPASSPAAPQVKAGTGAPSEAGPGHQPQEAT